jgi:hypothetical protein
MSERKDEQWLDQELRRAVDGTTPMFDAEAWKQKHRAEYEVLLSRKSAAEMVGWGKPHPTGLRWMLDSSFCRLAVAAAIIIAIGLFLQPIGDKPEGPGVQANELPVRMLSMMSLRMAYQRGGFEALDQQLQESLDTFGPRPLDASRRELSESVKGS